MSALRIEGLVKRFGGRAVLDGVVLDVPEGALVAILGASGSGKTTLLRLVCGFEPADAGTIALDGRLVSAPGLHVPAPARGVGYVPQEGALFPHLSVAANVSFGLPRRQRRDRARIGELLRLVGLPPAFAARAPHSLSGGEQQRVALARALAPGPRLVLLDEPFSALDAGLRAETRGAVAAALRAAGATALLVTHDQAEALSLGDAVAVLREGRVAQMADPVTLYRRPVDAAMARFVGEAVMLPGMATAGRAACALGLLALAGPVADGPVTLMLRPEQIRLVAETEADAVGGVVREVVFHGHDARVEVVLGGGAVVAALVPGHASPSPGEAVWLAVRAAAVAYAP
ncbi:MAG: ABC transporter ATP-binding protein [Rhodospirillales bacterium]|nr:ABC transporter ATP-binding protein [Rhodospirillales bacterium]